MRPTLILSLLLLSTPAVAWDSHTTTTVRPTTTTTTRPQDCATVDQIATLLAESESRANARCNAIASATGGLCQIAKDACSTSITVDFGLLGAAIDRVMEQCLPKADDGDCYDGPDALWPVDVPRCSDHCILRRRNNFGVKRDRLMSSGKAVRRRDTIDCPLPAGAAG